ncbi:hypothetical protein Pfo_001676 [Paulownia fortunei]|nr:hypothetical protein Pfo_001676 [Paulownia fortunei]
MSKLLILATRFENLIMEENETIAEFNAKLYDIANEVYALGEKYIDFKLIRKVLRSLLERFTYKITDIEEVRDLTRLRIKDLHCRLKLKMNNIMEMIMITLTLLTKNFGRFLKHMNKENKFPKVGKIPNSQRIKRIQCRECEGFGHIQAECANTLKKMGKSLNTIWSDGDSEEEQEEHVSNYVVVTLIILKKEKQTETLDTAKDVIRNVAISYRYESIFSPSEICLNSVSLADTDSNESSDDEKPNIE